MLWSKKLLILSAACFLAVPQIVKAEGFGLNEWTAEGVAMGGARMFAENDAGNIAYNPASITKVQGKAFKKGAVYISPHGNYKAITGTGVESGKNRVHPAWAPHSYSVKQIDDKQWIGFGTFARFGLVSEFEKMSAVSTNATLSKMLGASITPTYAYKFDDKVSAAVGIEFNYVDLELQKDLNGSLIGQVGKKFASTTEGKSWGIGWNAATNYKFDDKNEIGLVYRSKISHTMNADFKVGVPGLNSKAHGKVVLPDSYTLGYNHKFNDQTRVELQGMYTRWSTYEALNIRFDNPLLPDSNDTKKWKNGWRYAIGVEHKLSDKYSLLAGFAYDGSVIPNEHSDYMIPTGARRTYSIGTQYHDKKQTLAVALGYIDINGISIGPKANDKGFFNSSYTHNNSAKVLAVSYQLHF